jgi:cytochrome c peroxidase
MTQPRRTRWGRSAGAGRAGEPADRMQAATPGPHAAPPAPRRPLRLRRARARELAVAAAAFALATLVGVTLTGALRPFPRTEEGRRAVLTEGFARPAYVPHPGDNPTTPAKVALGKRLFEEVDLSATGSVACASCHDPRLAFADGEAKGRGVSGRRLKRHTPSLWNVAFSPLLFWDGRAASLEEQVHYPVEHPDEMGSNLDSAADRLVRRSDYLADFAQAFPEDPQPSPRTIARALAAYERTLISPPTRFDRFIAGDDAALSASERRGFAIFTGKGRCVGCHSGPSFTDHNFYDIGLPGEDRGRGAVIGLSAADHAFKTPTLRELAWSAPYMHDGSLATLDDVVRHYERGGVRRATLSGDLPADLRLSEEERGDLVAFLETLSSENPPQPSTEAWADTPPAQLPPTPAARVSQIAKTFTPSHIRLAVGETLTILNDDTRTHNVRIHDPRLHFNSGVQEPRESVAIPFPDAGSFEAFCAIHPSMRLRIEVE